MKANILWVAVTVPMIGLPGCTVSTNDPVVAGTGTLTVEWTINGSSDPNRCNQSVVTDFDIVVTSPDGTTTVGDFEQACIDGTTTITLDPGTYAADAALLDGAGAERTTRVPVDPFTIRSNSDLSVVLDFPASSFL